MDDTDPDGSSGTGDDSDTIAGFSRRTVVRGLVGAALGIPLAVEARTLLGMLDQQFLGGADHGEGTAAASPSTVGVGDQLLPGTTAIETLASAVVEVRDAGWTFVCEVTVENTTDSPYEFRIEAVRTTGGTVDAGVTTGRLNPGATTTLRADLSIPAGSSPTALSVTAHTGTGATEETVTERVALGNVPVKRRR